MSAQQDSSSAFDITSCYQQATSLHGQRRLGEAYRLYQQLLRADPPRESTAQEQTLILAHAPRLFVTPDEPFPLKDAAAILHPDQPLIAYHLFWEDDIDFPDDQEPCDHEVLWVRYGPPNNNALYTYYHDYILTSPAAMEEAKAHGGRPRVDVQWGKHGSLPYGWQELYGGLLLADVCRSYDRLHTHGRRERDNPLARRWPTHYTGSWEAFTDFSHEVDLPDTLRRGEMGMVSRWCNAVINTHFLRYNFHPKTDWPDQVERAEPPVDDTDEDR